MDFSDRGGITRLHLPVTVIVVPIVVINTSIWNLLSSVNIRNPVRFMYWGTRCLWECDNAFNKLDVCDGVEGR